MLFLLRSSNGSVFYLTETKEYIVGRKDCDLLIANDQSVSRKHAILLVKADGVSLIDTGAKYNTYLNDVKLEPNIEKKLKHGDLIQFGILQSKYTFEGMKLVVATSNISTSQRKVLLEDINFLNGTFTSNWTSDCTHVTVSKITLTCKVLCAVIEGQVIVNVNYWNDFVENVKRNLPVPDIKSYKPPLSEDVLNKNISMEYNPLRRQLFQNKTFIFLSSELEANMSQLIQAAGGTSMVWDRVTPSKEEIKNSSIEYLFIQNSNDSESMPEFTQMVTYLRRIGKRLIPTREVAMAIISCSCENDCNPNFDRTKRLMLQTQEPKFTPKLLAPVTQTQVKQEVLANVEENFDNDSPSCSKISQTQFTEEDHILKRKGEKVEKEIVKVMKTCKEQDASTGCFVATMESTKSEPDEPKESISIGKNKRKAEDFNIPAKKTNKSETVNPFESFTKFTQKKSETSSRSNPFECTSKLPASDILTSTRIEEDDKKPPQLDFSEITPVDDKMQKSSGWCFKRSPAEIGTPFKIYEDVNHEGLDQKMRDFIDSFRDSVVVEVMRPVIRKPTTITFENSNVKNFKTFKKVMPLHLQTRIIPRSAFKTVVCNENNALESEELSESDNEIVPEIIPVKIEVTTKVKRKQFNF